MKTLVQTSMQRILAFFFSFFSFTLSLFHSSSQFKEFDFSVGFLEKRTCCSQHVFCSREGFTSCCTRRESGKSESTNSHRACSRYYQIKWSEVKHQWNKLIIRWKGCRFFIYLFILSLFKAQTFFPCFFSPLFKLYIYSVCKYFHSKRCTSERESKPCTDPSIDISLNLERLLYISLPLPHDY